MTERAENGSARAALRRARAALVALAALTAASSAAAATASGTFQSKSASFKARSAYAFKGASFLDKGQEALLVAVTNVTLKPEMLSLYHDRKRAIEMRIKDEDTAVVYFEFKPDGTYRGLSYFFASGNGCGYCGGAVTSTVKLADGKLAGGLKGDDKESERRFDLTLDVPIAAAEPGAALPPDGGAPGKVYMTYHKALVDRSPAALEPTLSDSHLENFAAARKSNDLDGFLSYLRKEHPSSSVKITKGWSKAGNAVLLVSGASGGVKLKGEVVLVEQRGGWRVDDELFEVE